MGSSRRLRNIVLGGLLVLALIATGVAFTYHEFEQSQYRDRVALASEMQLLSQRLATGTLEAAGGSEQAITDITELRNRFDDQLERLRDGGDGLLPLPEAVSSELAAVNREWSLYRDDVTTVIVGSDDIEQVTEFSEAVEAFSPELARLSDDVVRRMVQIGESPEQIYVASRQTMLIQRIANNLNQVLQGGAAAATAIERFERDATLYGRVLDGLIEGFEPLGIERVNDAETQRTLQEIATLFIAFSEAVEGVLDTSSQIFEINAAASAVEARSGAMLDVTGGLEVALNREAEQAGVIALVGFALGGLALLLLIAMGLFLYRDTKRELAETEAQNERNQQAILRLLDEMMNLADGDLTVNATVTEDFTGAIADSMNYAIENLRTLVATINTVAADISESSAATRSQVLGLAEKSEEQAREIQQANDAIDEVSHSVDKVAQDAGQSAQVARNSVEIASKGAATVRRSIEGMDTIREQIQETAKRIKRLGESSQEIGDIIGLINDIAEQTNVLALNAAIQASAAGEAGRGFAVVADEVQRLAERSSGATRQVEGLVKAIQADTSEAVSSMEQSTANVVSGAEMAQAAGEALAEIEQVSADLADLIDGIANSARQQSEMARNVTSIMGQIREITSETTQGTQSTAAAIGDLAQLSAQLQSSVSDFKLPDPTLPEPGEAAAEPDASSEETVPNEQRA
ncbi:MULTISPECIES: methyl-accepting chemotaxis protein [unclassified Thioalkalivibrio]|uniref:methyl-accepting chemotaxis protein n=1 Tax=unclassified Thioalkalivibrio TaxID=2621013 RepID=UPI00056F0A22|nr:MULTISPECIES: methyl-accepting chemotaxis protein [unclassified Thioalkalivibrio]